MGTFQGHLLPGAFFISFALWWTVQITKRAWICERKSLGFYNTATYSGLHGKCLRWPLEGIVKVLVTGVGMALELFASTDYGKAGEIVYLGDVQHVTMYFFFFMSGVVDILQYRRVLCLPAGSDYVALALAFVVEYLLFSHHLHGRDELDVLVHTLLLYAIQVCVVTCLVEYKYPQSLLGGYARAWSVLVQGTWFVHVGIILYPPHPSLKHWEASHDDMTIAIMVFCWHLGLDIIFMAILSAVARTCYRRYLWHKGQDFAMVGTREEDMEMMTVEHKPYAKLSSRDSSTEEEEEAREFDMDAVVEVKNIRAALEDNAQLEMCNTEDGEDHVLYQVHRD